jgi:hypothetical protein
MAELIMNFRKEMEMSGHALAALSPVREPPVLMEQEAEWTPGQSGTLWRREEGVCPPIAVTAPFTLALCPSLLRNVLFVA